MAKNKPQNNSSKQSANKQKPNNNKSGRVLKPGCDKKDDIKMSTPDDNSGDINDSSYYYYSEDLKQQITNFSFNEYLGRPIPYYTDASMQLSVASYPANIMCILVNPSVAPTGDPTLGRVNGVNLAGLKNFTDITKKNGKRGTYGPEHMTILTLALAEIVKLVSFCSRPFGMLDWFDVRNRSIPRLYFNAMDIDYDDFISNAADYRIRLNTIIANIDKVPIPLNIPILAKASDWFKTVYVDKDNPMHQSYIFCPYSTWVLDETGASVGSVLETTYLRTTTDPEEDFTFKRYLDVLDLMVQRLLQSETMQQIFSDLMLAASNGEAKLGSLTMVPSDYRIEMALSSEIRNWVHNMVILSPPVDQDWKHELYARGNTGANDVWGSSPDAGIIYNPEFYSAGQNGNWRDNNGTYWNVAFGSVNAGLKFMPSLIVDFDHEPTTDEKIECLRFANRGHWTYDAHDTSKKCYYCNDMALGDSYVVDALIYYSDSAAPRRFTSIMNGSDGSAGLMNIIGDITDFNDSPMCYLWMGPTTGSATPTFGAMTEMGELNYFTMLDHNFMQRMYDAEMVAEFTFR